MRLNPQIINDHGDKASRFGFVSACGRKLGRRSSDLAWIQENLHIFFPAARRGFEESGRGAIVTDTTTLVKHERGESNPFAYVPSEEIYRGEWLDAIRMVREYDPSWEFVAVLLKANRESAYRIGVPSQKK